MSSEFEAKLDALFARQALKKAQAEELLKQVEDKAAEFLAAFEACRESVIRPAMLNAGALVKARGLEYAVESSEEAMHADGRRISSTMISMAFFRGERSGGRATEYPRVSFTCEKSREEIAVYMSTMSALGGGGKSGPEGSVKLEQITEAFVEENILKLLSQIL